MSKENYWRFEDFRAAQGAGHWHHEQSNTVGIKCDQQYEPTTTFARRKTGSLQFLSTPSIDTSKGGTQQDNTVQIRLAAQFNCSDDVICSLSFESC